MKKWLSITIISLVTVMLVGAVAGTLAYFNPGVISNNPRQSISTSSETESSINYHNFEPVTEMSSGHNYYLITVKIEEDYYLLKTNTTDGTTYPSKQMFESFYDVNLSHCWDIWYNGNSKYVIQKEQKVLDYTVAVGLQEQQIYNLSLSDVNGSASTSWTFTNILTIWVISLQTRFLNFDGNWFNYTNEPEYEILLFKYKGAIV